MQLNKLKKVYSRDEIKVTDNYNKDAYYNVICSKPGERVFAVSKFNENSSMFDIELLSSFTVDYFWPLN